jgi:hypothetical protein
MAQIKNDENSEYRHSSGKYKGQLKWVAIAKGIPGRTDQQCRDHWTNTLDPTISHEDWTEDKDDQLRHLVQTFAKKNGKPNWPAIAGQIDGKTPKQCRDHYYNTLNPEIHKSPWTAEEDAVLTELVQRHGEGNWAAIAEQIPGRTAKQVQNRWKSLNRFQQQQQQPQAPAPADWPQTPADYYRLSADQAPADRPLPLLNIRQAPADQNPAVRYFQQAENQAPALVQPLQPVTIFPTKITDFLN